MIWVGHVTHMSCIRNAYKLENLKGGDFSEDFGKAAKSDSVPILLR
jgi:hypothetical protein